MDDFPAGEFDFYNNGLAREVMELGTYTLGPGVHTLRITLTGANAHALKRHLVGLDYLVSIPVGSVDCAQD